MARVQLAVLLLLALSCAGAVLGLPVSQHDRFKTAQTNACIEQ